MVSLCYWPKLVGAENLPPNDEPVMYIPNHCSYLDIFTLSGTVPRAFKYMSKQEILQIPIIGWAMQMAGHIGIKRMDKRSQLEAFKAGVKVVPVSIFNLYKWMPTTAGTPLAFPRQ